MNTTSGPGSSEDQEPVGHLLHEVCGLADEAAERIPDSVVNARLSSVLRKAGYTSETETLAVARWEAEEILAAARRQAAEASAEAACAEAAARAARHEAEQAIFQGERYQDAALKQAASIVAQARGEASRIIEQARVEASRITQNGNRRHVPARPTAQALRDDTQQLRDIQDLISKLQDVNRKLALPIRAITTGQPADAESGDVALPLHERAGSQVAS